MKYITFVHDKIIHCVYDTGCVQKALQGTDVLTPDHGSIPSEQLEKASSIWYTSIDPILEYDLYFKFSVNNLIETVDKHVNADKIFDFSLAGKYAPLCDIPNKTDLPCVAVPFNDQIKKYKQLLFMMNRPSQNRIIFQDVDLDTSIQCVNKIDGHLAKNHYGENIVYFDNWIKKYNKYYSETSQGCT